MTITTVSDARPRVQYTGTGSQTEFPASFPVRSLQDLSITIDGEVPAIGYSVGGLNTNEGITVVFNEAPEIGAIVTIERAAPYSWLTNYGQQKAFVASAVNGDFADLVMMVQQVRDLFRLCLQVRSTDAETSLTLPNAEDRAGAWLGFDDDGAPIAIAGTAGDVEVTTFWEAMLQLANAAASRSALGLGTAALKNTGTDDDQVPTNADLPNLPDNTDPLRFATRSLAFFNLAR